MSKEQKTLKIVVGVLAALFAIYAFFWLWAHIIPIIIIAALCAGAYMIVSRKALSGGRKTLP